MPVSGNYTVRLGAVLKLFYQQPSFMHEGRRAFRRKLRLMIEDRPPLVSTYFERGYKGIWIHKEWDDYFIRDRSGYSPVAHETSIFQCPQCGSPEIPRFFRWFINKGTIICQSCADEPISNLSFDVLQIRELIKNIDRSIKNANNGNIASPTDDGLQRARCGEAVEFSGADASASCTVDLRHAENRDGRGTIQWARGPVDAFQRRTLERGGVAKTRTRTSRKSKPSVKRAGSSR